MNTITEEVCKNLRDIAELFIGLEFDEVIKDHPNMIPVHLHNVFRQILDEVNSYKKKVKSQT